MSESKFFIYGGGKWRQVDIIDGRVEGWGRARFVYPRRGKVHTAKTKSVLAALRNLAAKEKSSAKDGARLPQKELTSFINSSNKADKETYCGHNHCCQHANENGYNIPIQRAVNNNTNGQYLKKIDASIQTTQSLLQENVQRPVLSQNTPLGSIRTPRKNLSIKRKRSRSDENVGSPKKVARIKLQKADKIAETWTVVKSLESAENLPKSSENVARSTENCKTRKSSPKSRENRPKPTEQSRNTARASNDGIKSSERSPKLSEQINKTESGSKRSDNAVRSPTRSQKSLSSLKQSQNPHRNSGDTTKPERKNNKEKDHMKELVIDERDVNVLYKYLIRNREDFDPLRFELDNEYKRQFFFEINPLVTITHCSQIARMLAEEESLNNFATQLGLQKSKARHTENNATPASLSNSERKQSKKSRALTKLLYVLNKKHDKSNDSDSSDTNELANEIVQYLQERKKQNERKKSQDVFTSQASPDKVIMVQSPKENSEKRQNGRVLRKKAEKPKMLTPKYREYTAQEDQEIISWVMAGNRAQCVNGNRIWIELQDQFNLLTGHYRTFHSLRNRYLRYILPTLGLFALSPSDVARLRAAAATGELKARKTNVRRNSIYGIPSRGALSRKPAILSSSAEIDSSDSDKLVICESPQVTIRDKSPKLKSPRYSEITRKFAEKHRHSTSTNTPTDSPARQKEQSANRNTDMCLRSEKSLNAEELSEKRKISSESDSSVFNIPHKKKSYVKSSDTSNSSDFIPPKRSLRNNSFNNDRKRKLTGSMSESEPPIKRQSLRKKENIDRIQSPSKEFRTRKLYNPVCLL